jgi:hypothetical protein
MQLITVSTLLNSADANLTASRLDAAGFHPFIKGEFASLTLEGSVLAAGGIQVQVPDVEAADAAEFLAGSVTLDQPLE